MVRHRDFSHGAAFSERISAVGFDWSNAGENIATGFLDPDTRSSPRGWPAPATAGTSSAPIFREVGTGLADQHGSPLGASNVDGTWTQASAC